MTGELKELQERFSNLSDDELLKIVHIDYADYREEALEIAKEELNKRNIKDIKEDKKEELNKKSDDIPVHWLRFYTYIRIPVGLLIIIRSSIGHLIKMTSVAEKSIYIGITASFSIFLILVFIGLHKRKLWGWKLNWALIVVEIILTSIGYATNVMSFSIYLAIAALLWFLPNYIYFNKRRLLFS